MTTRNDPDFENVFDTVVSKPMKHDIRVEFALAEREVWTRAACAVASANDCKSTKLPSRGPTQSLMRMLNVSVQLLTSVKTYNF